MARVGKLNLSDLNQRLTPSAIALVLANLVPLYGVLFLGWRVFPVILLFWFENVVIGAYNVLKIVFARPDDIGRWIGKVVMVPFFMFHFGMFCFVHGIFVVTLFGEGTVASFDNPGVEMFTGALAAAGVTWAAAALIASHGFSFGYNYILKGEYRRAELQKLMGQPYARVVVLHVVIIASGFLVMAFGAPVVGLLLLVLLKMGVDLAAHLKERGKFAALEGEAAAA
jgi:hypothetical protein